MQPLRYLELHEKKKYIEDLLMKFLPTHHGQWDVCGDLLQMPEG